MERLLLHLQRMNTIRNFYDCETVNKESSVRNTSDYYVLI